jgi:ATP synthase I subunit
MPATSEDGAYARITRRIVQVIPCIAALGAIGLGIRYGVSFAAGFLIGALLSYLSFWRWRNVVESLGGEVKPRRAWLLAARSLGLVALAYVIVNYLEVKPVAVFLGLLVSAAAVVVSILYELIYART